MLRKTLHELAQSAREGLADERKRYMAGVAEAIYQHPKHFGFRNSDEVSEAFCHYWTRIEALPDHYINAGVSFEAYLASSLRYIAQSIRRSMAKEYDRQAVCFEDQYRASHSGNAWNTWSQWEEREGNDRLYIQGTDVSERGKIPASSDDNIIARAFRMRLVFLCLKCAYRLDDSRLSDLSRLARIDEGILTQWVAAARSELACHSIRVTSRRHGRDSAWVRIGVNRRRLTRELDPDKRNMLKARLERDQRAYDRACDAIHHSRSMLSNRRVAAILGISKATVDSGVGRILKKYSPLYIDEDG